MKIQEFLEHHGIEGNPFAEEDAQNDTVFKRTCLESTFHPGWDKIYGSPEDPSTSIVFGEKGAGKTALKLQMVRQFERHNEKSRGPNANKKPSTKRKSDVSKRKNSVFSATSATGGLFL